MKIIHQSFEILDDCPLKDINKRIELIGRVCYKSENHITDYSAEKFVEKIISNGHESVLEHISFCFEIKVKSEYAPRFFLFANYIHDRVVGFHSNVVDTSQGVMTVVISFNLRTLRDMACLTTLPNLLVKDILIKVYSLCPALIKDRFTTDDFRLFFLDSIKWQNPDELNLLNYCRHKYVTVRFIMDRGISHELVRHRISSFSQESTRYVNYNKSGVSFITPVDFELNDEDIKLLEMMEGHYNKCINNGRSPQQARYFLPNGLKTEIIMTANMGEWMHVLKLRTKKGVHPQMIAIMNDLKEVMYKKVTKIL
jgi:thymidylate synthase (FAD)